MLEQVRKNRSPTREAPIPRRPPGLIFGGEAAVSFGKVGVIGRWLPLPTDPNASVSEPFSGPLI